MTDIATDSPPNDSPPNDSPANTFTPGIDLSFVDPDIRVQDDLFAHVNGRWLRDHQIPDDRAADGAFLTLRDAAEEHVKAVIEDSAAVAADPDTIAGKIGNFYASFMDTEAIEASGLDPIQADLDLVAECASPDRLSGLLGQLQRSGIGGLFGYYIDTDAKNSGRYLVSLTQSGISLPDESYYREDKYAEIREKYVAHVEKMFALAGYPDPAARAATVLDLETQIAAVHWDVVARRDAEKSYNLNTFDEMIASAPGYDFNLWVISLVGNLDVMAEINVNQPSFVTQAAALFTSVPFASWQTWATWKVLHSRAPYLPAAFVEENFAFYGTTLSGAPEMRDRWKRGVGVVEEHLGFAVGKLYTAKHFPPDSKAKMEVLVGNLIEAYRRNITKLEWMTPETRQKALEKLDKFTPKIGYPDTDRDYSELAVESGNLVENIKRGNAFEHDREFAKIGSEVDRDEWFMTPQTVNAYYNPGMNEIVFPAAILQPPFFSPDSDNAVNYGGIGAVIGHEIGHGFDDQGAKYDGDGNLVDWWSDADRTEFSERTRALIEQYDQFTPAGLDDSYKVNGAFTIGENIGDLGGLSIALVAYEIAQEGVDAAPIDGLTALQRVFFSWAQVWRGKNRPEDAIQRLAIDPHSPVEFRCNGVLRNVDAFYDAFSVTTGDELYLEPGDRVQIW